MNKISQKSEENQISNQKFISENFSTEFNNKNSEKFQNLPILGPYKYPDGTTYTGQYKKGKRHGLGEQVWLDGSVYQGYWENDSSHGIGIQCFSQGDVYKGEWFEGMSHGNGEYYHSIDQITYCGEWVKGAQEGKGKEVYGDGSVYEG